MFGRIVVCPQCGQRIEVPFESDPNAESLYRFMKQKRAEEKAARSEDTPTVDRTDFEDLEPDEVDRWIDEFWATVPENGDVSRDRIPHPHRPPGGPGSVAESVELTLGAFATGKTWFHFNVLLVIVFLLGVCGGFLFHYVLVGFPEREQPRAAAELPLAVEGRLQYRTPEGDRIPDADAVVLLLPLDRIPALTVSGSGLRPDDKGAEPGAAAQVIEEWGGVFRRTGVDGSFGFSLPLEGRYLVLAISSHARREVLESDPATLQQLSRFFRDPLELLEEYCFVCEEYDFVRGTTILRYTFTP